ncbi:hypothetical protein TNIN_148951 [Trichonephila inaurata madagascariensis]|uniref:Uncharacterized protein n=1 Tax=Trichonephila inaurata madagascariensis TaxID=2747483 RepID=A0A8X6XEF4_9ARAC|nr:hypothetical protein TNIN_148951 [Trichonephila inaurata madagascariensis]
MTMAIQLILEGVFYSLLFILAILTQGNLPNVIQILAYVTIGEIFKYYLLLKLGAKPDSQMKSSAPKLKQPNIEKSVIPVVHSFMVFKICVALDIKVQFEPIENQNHDIQNCENQTNVPIVQNNFENNKSLPVVHSLMIYKTCEALGIKTELNPIKYPEPYLTALQNKRYKKKVPTVQSPAIFKFCEALGIQAQLVPQ